MAEQENFWLSDEGIFLRLEDLAGDFSFKTYNGALIGNFREAGFSELVWVGVEDDSICEDCLDHVGRVYRASGFLPKMPRHIRCRCLWDVWMEL